MSKTERLDKKGCGATGTLIILPVEGNEETTTTYNNVHDRKEGRKGSREGGKTKGG